MRENIHPEYHNIKIIMTDGSEFTTKSTWGKEGDSMRLDIDSKSHPAYTGGEQKLMMNDQMDKFSKRFGSFGMGSRKDEGRKEEPKADEAKSA